MDDVIPLVLAFAAGLGLGLVYFGGLWLTIRRLPTSRWPVVLTLGSLLGRTAVTLVGFYLVMAGHWERSVACLVGFALMRFVVVASLGPDERNETTLKKEGGAP